MWTVTAKRDRVLGVRVHEFRGPRGDLLRFGVTVPEALAAAAWGGTVKTRPEATAIAAELEVDTDADPVDDTVRLVVTAETAGLTAGEDYHFDLWFKPAGDDEPTTLIRGHLHPFPRVSAL